MELIKNQHINYFFEPAKSENKKGNIIFIHGFNALPSYFYLVSDYFIEYDCYFICLPGHGYTKVVNEKDLNPISFADAIINLIHELDLKKFYLLGHSLGGAIACMLAEALITRVEKLIVVCPFFYGFNKKILGAYALLPWFARKHPDKALKKIYFDYRNNFITHPKTRPEITPSSQNKEKYLWKLLLNMGFSSETHKRLKYAQSNLIVPTLLINSKNDQLIDYKTAAKKLAKTKDLQIYTFYKSGHIPFVEEPDLFAKVVLDYLNDRLVEQTQNEEVEESEGDFIEQEANE
ncbi:hypothetical protein JM47_03495 [Ureaplasma diversum]|uniref:AB hydrolase-1 domain-containing protein n=1 Tax=Ureaplasma diversum TaxID=42094 RepID=A0A0C5S2E5_9BACT|nr:alpha/beta hydrolase [Ureaplasma diversum]AJQ45590.1 hypothetical protein JM47_03495 [Ureaplasma diversum]